MNFRFNSPREDSPPRECERGKKAGWLAGWLTGELCFYFVGQAGGRTDKARKGLSCAAHSPKCFAWYKYDSISYDI